MMTRGTPARDQWMGAARGRGTAAGRLLRRFLVGLVVLALSVPQAWADAAADLAEMGQEATAAIQHLPPAGPKLGNGKAPAATAAAVSDGEARLVLPDLRNDPADPARVDVRFHGLTGHQLLLIGLLIGVGGLIFGLLMLRQIQQLPVHHAMADISTLIYETCKTYLFQQGKFLAALWVITAVIMALYFGVLCKSPNPVTQVPEVMSPLRVAVVLLFSVIGMLGSYGVAWFGIRVNTYANSRAAFSSLQGRPYPVFAIPLKAGMSIGMMLISVELLIMLGILLFLPATLAGPCFIGFAIGESLGAAVLRIAGGIFTKIADIGSDLMKIVFKLEEDDARNPGVIADCTGDNAGDSVGPSADGFETYGVTGVALVTFIMLAVKSPVMQVQLLVWIFALGALMILTSGVSYLLNGWLVKAKYGQATQMDFEAPLTRLVWLTSLLSIAVTYLASYFLLPSLGGDATMWWKLATIVTCGTLAGAVIPELVKVFTSTSSRHVNEVVTASTEGGPSLNILAGLVAGNYSAYWLGLVMVGLMGVAYKVACLGLGTVLAVGGTSGVTAGALAAVFAFGLVAFGFLSMAPVTIAVDSYGPVTDNAQSVYELSLIEDLPFIKDELRRDYGIEVDFAAAKDYLEANDGAGNTFKATAKPVLIGTAVVGATTMIFSIIMKLTSGMTANLDCLSILYPPFFLGLLTGGAVIYWFTGASIQAVSTGAYRAVEYIKANIKLDGQSAKASVTSSKKVVEICTIYAQKGMLNIFLTLFFTSLAFAFLNAFFFIGYLIAIAFFGLYQAVFMANAGGAWDNAKKVVECTLKDKGSDLHAACVVGDTVGDPFKDTSSVAMNPVIKFTTLFGLLAVSLAWSINGPGSTVAHGNAIAKGCAVLFFLISVYFVWRSFYRMRIHSTTAH